MLSTGSRTVEAPAVRREAEKDCRQCLIPNGPICPANRSWNFSTTDVSRCLEVVQELRSTTQMLMDKIILVEALLAERPLPPTESETRNEAEPRRAVSRFPIDGVPRTYRDRQDIALQTARFSREAPTAVANPLPPDACPMPS